MVKHEVGKLWGLSITVLGGYHIFMIPIGSAFHKTIYKRVWFSLFFPLKFYMLGKGINIYIYILKIDSQYAASQNYENNQFSFAILTI
jgi:hypothetical protein